MTPKPITPLLSGLLIALGLVVLILALSVAHRRPVVAPNVTRMALPPDTRLVCHDGRYYLASLSTDDVVALPFRCVET